MGKRGREAHVARGAATPKRPADVDESHGAQAVAAIRTQQQARGAARAARARRSYFLPSLRARPRPIATPAARVAASTARETSYTIIELTA